MQTTLLLFCLCACSATQSCLTLCNLMDYSLCPWDSPGKNTGVGFSACLQGIFKTQGLKPRILCVLHWHSGSLPLAPPGKPNILFILLLSYSPQGLKESDMMYHMHRSFNEFCNISFLKKVLQFLNIKVETLSYSQAYSECVYVCVSRSVVSNSLRPHGLQPTRFLCPWDSPGKSTGVGCHFLLQNTFT